MKPFALVPAFLILVASQDAAAQLFKCTDKAGKMTYTSRPCQEFGLKDGGEIKDRLQVTPAPPPSVRPAARPSPAQQAAPSAPPVAAPAEEKKPERRCFTTTVKGRTVTRCNDKPDEPAE